MRVSTPSEVVLRSVRLLRESAGKKVDETAIPHYIDKRFLRQLSEMVGASCVALYFFGKKGFLVEGVRIGSGIPGLSTRHDVTLADVYALRAMPNAASEFIVAELSDGYRWRRGLDPLFGFILIHRADGFSVDEQDQLIELSSFIGTHVQQRESLLANLRHEREKLGLQRMSRPESRPGSRIAAGLHHLYAGTGASYAAFGVFLQGKFFLLYINQPQHHGHAKYVDGSALVEWSPSLLALCERGAVADVRPDDHDALHRLLGIPEATAATFRHMVVPVTHGKELVAAFFLAFSKHAVEYHEPEVVELARATVNQLAGDIRTTYAKISTLMIVEPVFRARNVEIQPDHAFVLMPFHEPWSTRIWERVIRPACASEGLMVKRADDLYGRDIVEDVWKSICGAQFVIADTTGRNPNVFYELGIAHTIGKDVILLTQSVADIPFDLNRYRHIVYSDDIEGCEKLQRELVGTLQDMKRTLSATS